MTALARFHTLGSQMKRIKHNDLTHYFLRPHEQLPRAYLRKCEKFIQSIQDRLITKKDAAVLFKQQASSGKQQASSMEQLDPTIDWNKFTKELTNK